MEDASVKRTAVPIFGGAVRLAQRLHLDSRAAKTDCHICKEWQVKYRTQSKKFFFEAEHLRRAVRKTLDQCQLFLPAASFKLFEESLQLDVRFFSEHNVCNILEEEEPLIMAADAGEVERLKEKIDHLTDEIEKLESQNLKLQGDLRGAKEQVRMENVARQMNSALKTAARDNTCKPIMHAVESQTDELWWQAMFDEVEDMLGPSMSMASQEEAAPADEGKRKQSLHSAVQRLSMTGAAAQDELAKVKAERDLLQVKLAKSEKEVKSLEGAKAEAVASAVAATAASTKAADREGAGPREKKGRGRKASPVAVVTDRPRTPPAASLKEVATNTDELRWDEFCTAEQKKLKSPKAGGPGLSVFTGSEERVSTAGDSVRHSPSGGEAVAKAFSLDSSGRLGRRVSTPVTEQNMALAPRRRHGQTLSSVGSGMLGKEESREMAVDGGGDSRERPLMVDKCVGVSEWDGMGDDPIERSLGCKGSQVLPPPAAPRRSGKAFSKEVRSTPNLGVELHQEKPRSAPAKSGNVAVKVPSNRDREPAWVPGEVRAVKSASLTKIGSKRWTHTDEAEPYLLHVWETVPFGHKKPSRTELVSLGAIMPAKKKFGETW